MNWLEWLDAGLGVSMLIRLLCILDHMGRHTCHVVRLASVSMAAAALAIAVGPMYTTAAPEWPAVLLHAALAIWLWVDRRQPGGVRQIFRSLDARS